MTVQFLHGLRIGDHDNYVGWGVGKKATVFWVRLRTIHPN